VFITSNGEPTSSLSASLSLSTTFSLSSSVAVSFSSIFPKEITGFLEVIGNHFPLESNEKQVFTF